MIWKVNTVKVSLLPCHGNKPRHRQLCRAVHGSVACAAFTRPKGIFLLGFLEITGVYFPKCAQNTVQGISNP